MGKPVLVLDFDGVVHSYTSGWEGADVVSDPPVPGAIEFIQTALQRLDVCIFSSRSGQDGGILAMRSWLWRHAGRQIPANVDHWTNEVRFPAEKPAAFLTIDDRAITFDGAWPDVDVLLDFKPWNKRGGPAA